MIHCNSVQGQNRARRGFSLCTNSHREKPVFITGNPCSHCRDPVFITGNSLWEVVHREIPVVITGNGFAVWSFWEVAQKSDKSDYCFSCLKTQIWVNWVSQFYIKIGPGMVIGCISLKLLNLHCFIEYATYKHYRRITIEYKVEYNMYSNIHITHCVQIHR